MGSSGCIFCGIMEGKKPARLIFEDESCVVLEDVNPQAPVHMLVVPRKHIATLQECSEQDEELLGHLLHVGVKAARNKGLTGFRTVINSNAEAGQTIFHLHIHVLGGRRMRWPPG